MQYASTLIVNHAVIQAGSSGYSNRVDAIVNYAERLQHHLERGGVDTTITEDDQRLARLQDMVDYRSREGKYAGRNEDIPMAQGQVSGGCFDLLGTKDPSHLSKEIQQSGSNLITSVVSVRREYAEDLGLTTKEDFQRLFRDTWLEHVEKLGVINPHNMRTAAWFHTDNPKNLHIHVLTWDASGRFSGDALIPKNNLMSARQKIVQYAYKTDLKMLYEAKDYVKALSLAQTRLELGQTIGIETHQKLTRLQSIVRQPEYRNLELSPKQAEISSSDKGSLRFAVFNGKEKGYVQYGSLPMESRALIDNYRLSLNNESSSLSMLNGAYMEISNKLAEMNGYKNDSAKSYIERQVRDLENRANNIISRDLNQAPEPTARNAIARSTQSTASITERTIKPGRPGQIERMSWAFTPEQKLETESLYQRLKLPIPSKERKELVGSIRDRILNLPSIQARIQQSSLQVARQNNINYREAVKMISSEYKTTIEKTIVSSAEKKPVVEQQDSSSSVSDILSAIVYALPGRTALTKSVLDSIQRNMNWKQNRVRHAMGKKNAIRQNQWNMMG